MPDPAGPARYPIYELAIVNRSWLRVVCRAGIWYFGGVGWPLIHLLHRGQPVLRKHLPCEILVNMRHDQAIEREEGKLSFVPASDRAIFGQISLCDDVGEQLLISAIG